MPTESCRMLSAERISRGCWAVLIASSLGSCAPPVREIKLASEYDAEPEPKGAPPHVASPQEPSSREPEPSPPEEPSTSAVAPLERKLPNIEQFYAALDALRAGERGRSVRVFWLGDSHTAADFMTQPIREHLARLAGDGGPGFVRLGLDGYRHGAASVKSFGRWRKAPILPAQRTRVLDGVFGYGGIRTLPAAAAGAAAKVREPAGKRVTWTLSYRLVHGAQVEVRLGEEKLRVRANEAGAIPGGAEFVQLSGADSEEFSVHHVAGDPQIFGAFVDTEVPGVTFDTVGINGARAATALAWEPEQFVAQVEARRPDLLVLAFGTNEVFDQTRPERYVEHNTKLVSIVRQAVPEIPCWIVGPPDSSTKEGNSKARVKEVTDAQARAAQEMGCAFTSAYELMGGEGSFNQWARAKPAKARGDRIHLTIAGYRELGELLAQALVEGVPLDELQQQGATPQSDSPADE